MKCLKCKYEFCWFCKKLWSKHSYQLCSQSMIGRYVVMMTIWLNISIMLGVTDLVWKTLCHAIYYLFNYLVYYNMCGALLIFLLYLMYYAVFYPQRYLRDSKKTKLVLNILLICAIMLSYSFFLAGQVYFFVKFHLCQGACMCSVGLIKKMGSRIRFRWLSKVL